MKRPSTGHLAYREPRRNSERTSLTKPDIWEDSGGFPVSALCFQLPQGGKKSLLLVNCFGQTHKPLNAPVVIIPAAISVYIWSSGFACFYAFCLGRVPRIGFILLSPSRVLLCQLQVNLGTEPSSSCCHSHAAGLGQGRHWPQHAALCAPLCTPPSQAQVQGCHMLWPH